MPVGIEIRKTNGTVLIAPGDRMCRVIGGNWTYDWNGFFDVPEFATMPGWCASMAQQTSWFRNLAIPSVYITQNPPRVNWTNQGNGVPHSPPIYIIWGVY